MCEGERWFELTTNDGREREGGKMDGYMYIIKGQRVYFEVSVDNAVGVEES